MGIGSVQETIRELAADFAAEGIDYAIIGALALNAHGYARETTDVDVLVTPTGLEQFGRCFIGRGYEQAFANARKTFRNARTGTQIEFVTSGDFPGDGKPKPVEFPVPTAVAEQIGPAYFVNLPTLIELKLASGMTQPARRRDLADIQDLIRILGLGVEYADQLHPYVRDAFRMLVEELKAPDPLRE